MKMITRANTGPRSSMDRYNKAFGFEFLTKSVMRKDIGYWSGNLGLGRTHSGSWKNRRRCSR
jgi:hypothetical protein